jgi:hypothetical protein
MMMMMMNTVLTHTLCASYKDRQVVRQVVVANLTVDLIARVALCVVCFVCRHRIRGQPRRHTCTIRILFCSYVTEQPHWQSSGKYRTPLDTLEAPTLKREVWLSNTEAIPVDQPGRSISLFLC